jgi:hypothetical protein
MKTNCPHYHECRLPVSKCNSKCQISKIGQTVNYQSAEETAWLIELEGPKWMAIIDGEPQWTEDPNKALRFARKEDADNLKAWWCMTAISTEHRWT